MTCKDCVHYDVCHRRINRIDFLPIINGEIIKTPIMFIDCKDVENRCGKFKDKTRIIDLPRKHGENVYFIKSAFSVTDEPIKATIVGISIMSDGAIYFNSVTEKSGRYRHFYSSAIGKAVFLTKEEAEEKLEELKNEKTNNAHT